MDANVPSEQRRVSTPNPVSHHVRTLNFALSQTAANVHRCDYCQKTFSSNRRRNQHARQLQHGVAAGPPPMRTTQPPANLYRCGDCQKTFSSNAGLNQHARTVHTLAAVVAVQPTPTQITQSPAKVYRCGDCLQTFASKGERKRHARTMHTLAAVVAVQPTPTQTTQPPAKLHRCGDCQKTFSSKGERKRHGRAVHMLAAVVAGQPTPTQTTQPHAKLHRCGDCQKTFSSNAGLNQHARTVHTLAAVVALQPTPTQTTQLRECCISTPGRFSHRILDLSFAASRTAAKVYHCGDCLQTFSSKGERKRHGRTIHKGAARPPRAQTTRPTSKTQENPRSAPPRKTRAGAAQRRDAHLETMQTKSITTYPTQCAVCDRLVPSPHWIAHVSDAVHAKSQREADIALKRRMSGHSRGRVQVDRLALDFGAAAGTQTLRVTNVGRSAVYFSPWIRGNLFVLKGGSEKRMLKPSASKCIEVKLVDAPEALRGRLRTRLDITFQLPGQEGRATATRLISA
ncbi:hypothetical protein B0H13DRAFT_2380418 [Mycena leptocephala]|nr:hypothetical protein B0H13DRAFT_2380418 [Mycena leptocephala]